MIKPITYAGSKKTTDLSPIKVPSFSGKYLSFTPEAKELATKIGKNTKDVFRKTSDAAKNVAEETKKKAPEIANNVKAKTSFGLHKAGNALTKLAEKLNK